ncbi:MULTISPECIES: NF038122 family metalloprotease [Bradyrhizobium]|uniref:NF038122 family metalloprotease n=1 Tax=Bradyrhizobium TaxID=374 RepID=UPI0004AF32C5|nr:NF038122 family metalloprotease [Bradyrhizobium elkanii]MCS3524544.1 hypothetical protein [Bradyrhizobium elkanii]MCS4072199.1 hypothetical protein [Bradyrhizobium elkanii]MCS4078833.1 hypothetical protein [Bradyrhizobium elkanii]MCW2122569.1 hypothetical protein [Bradyrhizobium elkanii]MCW2169316.1 hypothetical protein [Bradyrhizobium elkanii]
MRISLVFDSYANAAPQSFRDAIQAAANILDATFVDNITLNISIGYGEIQGGPEPSGSASAEPSAGIYASYSQVFNWLTQNASAEVQSGVAALPTETAIQGQKEVVVWSAEERLLGLLPPHDSTLDGAAGFATDIPTNLLTGVALHELTHAMSRVTYGPQPDILELFRFSGVGTRLFDGGIPSSPSYFSLDGGRTDLADYGQTSDPSDYLNTSGHTPNDPFNEFYDPSTAQSLSRIDILQMESLGFHAVPPQLVQQPTIHANDLNHAATASGYNHFIDLLNFEASFPDLIAAFGLNQGAMQNWYDQQEPIEGRVASFDGLDYVASYPDLIAAFGNAGTMTAVEDAGARHFIQYGHGEQRSTSFNGLDYIASYSDLISAFGANGDAGAFHFIEHGFNEHRATTFDGLDYIASYPDLIGAFGANEQAGAIHFIDHGWLEHRTTTFDGLAYIAGYPDLMLTFGANNDLGARHYIDYGAGEHRTTAFNVAAYEQAHPDLIGVYATDDQFLTAYVNYYAATGHYLT